ncbi:hypothetical protein, partial [Sphingobacterium multivorum]
EKNKPTQSVFERYMQLKACKHVDMIIPYATEQDLEDVLRSYKIHVRILGDEYMDKAFTGRQYCEEKGIRLYFNRRENRFSSSSLRRIIASKENTSKGAVVSINDGANYALKRINA